MRQILNLNSKWAFTKMVDAVPTKIDKRWDFVNLPHSWNSIDGQDGDNDYYRGTAYYAKTLNKADLPEADRYYLEFRGANSSATVYVNGTEVANHDGGYSTWRVDVTEHLTAINLIAVAVDNAANDRVYPQMADFTFYGGLYRDVNLICVNNSHFDLDYYGAPGIKVTPEIKGEDADVLVETYVTNSVIGQEICYTITDKDGKVVAETVTNDTSVTLNIPSVHLWNGRPDPYLYTVTAELISDAKVLDNVSTRFGCRTFEIDPENGFILNGKEYPLRGVSRHQDRWGKGNALSKEDHHKR